jgi:hypothetical protein
MRTPLGEEEYRQTMQAMSWRPDPVQQLARLRWLAGRHTFTIEQVTTLVATIQHSCDRAEALFELRGSVYESDLPRAFVLLDARDQDALRVRLNECAEVARREAEARHDERIREEERLREQERIREEERGREEYRHHHHHHDR